LATRTKTRGGLLLEQHRRLDLDDDGYDEPYIVTVDKEAGKVLRIEANFSERDIEWDG
jgi:chaperonin GroES